MNCTFANYKDEDLFYGNKRTCEIGVEFSEEAKQQIALYNKMGWDKMPICMAKTQMSLSDDAKKYGAPKGFMITVRELNPS